MQFFPSVDGEIPSIGKMGTYMPGFAANIRKLFHPNNFFSRGMGL